MVALTQGWPFIAPRLPAAAASALQALPFANCGSVRSNALRAGGKTSAPWLAARDTIDTSTRRAGEEARRAIGTEGHGMYGEQPQRSPMRSRRRDCFQYAFCLDLFAVY